jgi:iron-sulfur cluster assembly accessory protein
MTPILDGVEGIGFECDGEGAVVDRTLGQLHFAKDPEETPMVELTENAASAFKRLIGRDQGEAKGIRLSLVSGGCGEFQFKLDLAPAANDGETICETSGVPIFVNRGSAGLIKGTRIDYVESLDGGSFIFQNPNAETTCVCGQSFTPSRDMS